MSSQGLSLVGFMDQQQAINYLRSACVYPTLTDAALIAEWQTAKGKLGAPIANAGNPTVQNIPATHTAYTQQLAQAQWLQPLLQGPWVGADFKLVDIDPLLAYQFSIDTTRSNNHCSTLTRPPTLDEMLAICLPLNQVLEPYETYANGQSILIKTKSLNVQPFQRGLIPVANGAFLGMHFGTSLSLSHVVKYNGRYYLHNGFHRALGIRAAGGTYMPCLVRDVVTPEEAGIKPNATFQINLLESGDPPTLGHYTQGRSHTVALRQFERTLHVSWSEYITPAE